MNTSTTAIASGASPTADSVLPRAKVPARIPGERPSRGVPFTRLLAVEARKMFDTKAGRWLLILIGAVIAITLTALWFVNGGDHSYADYIRATSTPMSMILPVVGILAVTSEWSQRTSLVTYGLEPRRARVTWAKLLVALGVGLVAMVVAVVLAAAAHQGAVMFRGVDAAWGIDGLTLFGVLLFLFVGLAQGVAFGMLLRNSPAAIVLYFLIPTVWSIVAGLGSGVATVASWLNTQQTISPLTEGSMTGEQWAQLGTSVGVWVALPLVVGMVIVNRAEVK